MPVGSQVTDRDGRIWTRIQRGWESNGLADAVVGAYLLREYGPLTSTPEKDR